MRWRRRDVAIARQCTEASYILMVEDDAERIEGVQTFKYLRIMLDLSDDDFPEVLRNFRKDRWVCSWLRKLIKREGAELQVSDIFYWAVVKAVFLLGTENWVFPEAVFWKLEGLHMGFLNQITGQMAVQHKDGTWRCVVAEKFLKK